MLYNKWGGELTGVYICLWGTARLDEYRTDVTLHLSIAPRLKFATSAEMSSKRNQ